MGNRPRSPLGTPSAPPTGTLTHPTGQQVMASPRNPAGARSAHSMMSPQQQHGAQPVSPGPPSPHGQVSPSSRDTGRGVGGLENVGYEDRSQWSKDRGHWDGKAGLATGFAEALKQEIHAEHRRVNQRVTEVEQGPRVICILMLAGGIISFVDALVVFFLHFARVAVLALYLVCFALMVIVFEAPQDFVVKVPIVRRFQEFLIRNIGGLCDIWGRGLFSIFQGTLWFSICVIMRMPRSPHLGVGLYLVLVGLGNALAHHAELGKYATVANEDEVAMSLGPQICRTQNTQDRLEAQAEKQGYGPVPVSPAARHVASD